MSSGALLIESNHLVRLVSGNTNILSTVFKKKEEDLPVVVV
jgi:hypothetical protein